MKTDIDRLNDVAHSARRVNSLALQAQDALRQNAPGKAEYTLSILQGKTAHIERQLVLMGADDPVEERTRELLSEERHGLPPLQDDGNVPLHLLSSPKAQRAAIAVREAAIALREMEDERGIIDGLAERFEDFADIYEMEVFGPTGLEESLQ